jgi:hypothetical protein
MLVKFERNPCIVCKCLCCGMCKLFKSMYLNDNVSVWNFMCIAHLNERTLYFILDDKNIMYFPKIKKVNV